MEHFPDLYKYRIAEAQGQYLLYNETQAGGQQEFRNLVFHGGPGTTLEMRVFSESGLVHELAAAGFSAWKVYGEDYPEFGIVWNCGWSLPIAARR